MDQERICPNCGNGFVPGGRGLGKRFCNQACTRAFHNRSKGEGAVAIQLVKAWIETRHAPAGSREAGICRDARRELTQLARTLIAADRQAGRPPTADYVESLLAETRYMDRRRSRSCATVSAGS